MKKIIMILLLISFFSIKIQAQIDTLQLPQLISTLKKELQSTNVNAQQIEKEIQNFRTRFINPKSKVPLTEYKKFVKKSILLCDNGSFENNDLSGWTPISYYNGSGLPLGSNLYLAPPYPVAGASYGVNVLDNSNEIGRHWLAIEPSSSGFDDWLSTSTPAYNIPVVPPASGNYSLRLGNRGQYCAADAVAKTFTVTSANAILHFKYFFITQQFHQAAAGTEDTYSTFFLARAFDASTGAILKYKVERGVTGNVFLTPTMHKTTNYFDNSVPALPMANNETLFRDWTCVTWDLTDFIGKDVTLEFINSDCGAGGHKSVTYLDDICGTCTQSPITDGYVTLKPTDTCGFNGPQNTLTINGTYAAPIVQYGGTAHVGTISGLVINFYQGSGIVASFPVPASAVTMGSPNTFSVNVPSSLFSNITGCLDIVAEADFATINSVTGTPGVYHVESGIPRGIKFGKDNDFCVKCPCACSQTPIPYLFWLTGSGNAVADNHSDLACDGKYTDKLLCYQQYIIKVKSPCSDNCQPDQVITTIKYIPTTGSGLTGYTITGNTLTASLPGTYEVTIKVKCNGVWCKECKLTFTQTKKCEPPCDNCKVNGVDKVKAGFDPGTPSTSYTIGTYPTATTLNAGFFLGGGTDTYTQIRANIIDVQISSDNPACLQCYNNPNQWGSIHNGNLAGFTSTVSTYGAVSPVNGNNNPREIVFNTTTPATIPMMTPLTLSIELPGVNPLSCCCIHVTAFVKITFRNNKCEECSKVIKIEFNECGPNGNPDSPLQFGGHPQYRQHAPSNEDVKLMTDNKSDTKNN
jgi:hypothetical protein